MLGEILEKLSCEAKNSVKTFWFTGLSGAGKTSLGRELKVYLNNQEIPLVLLDGDELRNSIHADLGFTQVDRFENIRRTAEIAKMLNRNGIHVAVALISPLMSQRKMASSIIGAEAFREIHVATTLGVCQTRDPKGLYEKAARGEIKNFTGLTSQYESPEEPFLKIDSAEYDLYSDAL